MNKNVPEGLKVKFTHLRYLPHVDIPFTVWDAKKANLKPADFVPHQGTTVCRLINETGDVVAVGAATVNPGKDHFSKKIGRNISLGRALKNLGVNAKDNA